jgi:cellulose synthase/poly-beta-1,6-N-acetylglucosamine synthase-like glycosyltransferase
MKLSRIRQLVRRLVMFSLVGGIVFAAGTLLLVLLVQHFGMSEKPSEAVQLVVSILLSYVLSRHFVWRDRATKRGAIVRFTVSRVSAAVLAWIIYAALVEVGINYVLANTAAIVLTMGINFALSDKWVFEQSEVASNSEDLSDLRLTWRDALLVGNCIVGFFGLLWFVVPLLFVPLVLLVFAGLAMGMISFVLLSVLYPHRDEEQFQRLQLPEPDGRSTTRIAILIPARHEEQVLPTTIVRAAWGQRLHRSHTIMVIVNDDDPGTEHVARVAASVVNRHLTKNSNYDELHDLLHDALDSTTPGAVTVPDGVVRVIRYPLAGQSPSKPKQLNYGFNLVKDDYDMFTILDAESIAAERLLLHVDQAVRDNPTVDIFQGGVQLMPLSLPPGRRGWIFRLWRDTTKWFSWHNILEYYRWFSGQMQFQSDVGFMPLGGNTVFIRSQLLRQTEGWPDELTEDCALGVKAAVLYDAKTVAFYMPELATREEPPDTLQGFIKQRVRWNQGFLYTLITGSWRKLPGSWRRIIALVVLSVPFFQGSMAIMIPVTLITMVAVKSPPLLVLMMFVPFLLVLVTILMQIVHLHEFGKRFGVKVDFHLYLILPATSFIYQFLLTYCAARAAARHFKGDTTWQKTAHSGHHVHELMARRSKEQSA